MKPKTISAGGSVFIPTTVSEATKGRIPDDPRSVLLPYRPPDDHREFPADPKLENAYAFVGSGLAAHEVRRTKGDTHPGFAATDLIVFREDDWYGECFQVLLAHGWVGPVGGLSADVVSKVVSVVGASQVEEAKRDYGESWGCYIGEVAAVHFAEPLSRLWYAANLMSLFFVHQDDLRFGYLWAEYQLRKRHEVDFVRGKRTVASARAGGKLRADEHAGKRQEILHAMAAHIQNGKTISNAASLAKKAGLGRSPEANAGSGPGIEQNSWDTARHCPAATTHSRRIAIKRGPTTMALNSEPLLRDVDVSRILCCSKATFWRRVADGTFPRPLKIGGMSRWPQSEILAVIEQAKGRRR